MRILHLSASDRGGAGVAALRAVQAQRKAGMDSHLLCLDKSTSFEYVHPFHNRASKWKRFFLRYRNLVWGHPYQSGQNLEVFSCPRSQYSIHNHPLIQQADLIHMHWISGWLDFPSFFRNIQKPICWTLHDLNPMLGGFHYEGDRSYASASLVKRDLKYLQCKEDSIALAPKLSIIAPSPWIQNYAQQSVAFAGRKSFVIPNCIDLENWAPQEMQFCRSKLNWPQDKKILLFVSADNRTPRKGMDLVLTMLKQNLLPPEYLIMAAGQPAKQWTHQQLKYLGSIQDSQQLRMMYGACNAVLIPSREDNLPNVMLEAFAMGKPCVGFSIGGLQHFLQENVSGCLANSLTPDSLSKAIIQLFNNLHNYSIKTIRNFAQKYFSYSTYALSTSKFYHDILHQPSAISIWFTDFWHKSSRFEISKNPLFQMACQVSTLRLTPQKPQVLMYSVFGNRNKSYHCRKIAYTGESREPNSQDAQIVLGFEEDPSHNRYRLPLYRLYPEYYVLIQFPRSLAAQWEQRSFCAFLVSNSHDQTGRIQFFEALNQKKMVSSGGKVLNNVGGPVINTREFLSSHKFCITFENVSKPGYTTEKIVQAFASGCIPIYWGNPQIVDEFNSEAFINLHDFPDWNHAIDHIIMLNDNESACLKIRNAPIFKNNTIPECCLESTIQHRFSIGLGILERENKHE